LVIKERKLFNIKNILENIQNVSQYFSIFNNMGITQPYSFALQAVFPNPFNPITTIDYEVGNESIVELSIINLNGQTVENLIHSVMKPGQYSVNWNAKDIPSGLYLVRMMSLQYSATQKIILLK